MRSALLTLLTCALAVPPAEQGSAFFPVGIDYPPDARTPSSEIARDLQVIRSAGFNTIRTPISWRDVEPARGEYRFDALRRTLEVADRSGVRVILHIDRAAPAWVFTRGADGGSRADPSASKPDECGDLLGVRADRRRFVTMATKIAAGFRSLLAVDVGSPPPAGPCFAKLAEAARAAAPAGVLVNGHATRPSLMALHGSETTAHDHWMTARTVDRFGLLLDASTAESELSLALDRIAAASRRGWWLYSGAIPEPERRFAAWLAISRGARGLIFDDPPRDAVFVGTIARNPALFTQVRPRRSQVALVVDPGGESPSSARLLASVHRVLFERQIAADLVNGNDLADAITAGYRALVTSSRGALPPAAADAMKAYGAKGGSIVDAGAGAERVVEAVTAAGVTPDVRLDGGTGIEVRFLESPAVQMIVALNHAAKAQRVTMTFPPETQEAIWLNMETGNSVNFVAGPGGPFYQYWFRPRDVLVLMIRKDIR
jgi:hypothetical protein